MRERTPHEDGLEVDPLALNDVQLGEVVIDAANLLLNLLDLIGEALEVPRLLEGNDETLVITDLRDHVFPLLNQRRRSSIGLIVSQDELGVLAPNPQLIDSLPNGDLSLSLVTQVLDLLGLLDHDWNRLSQILEEQFINARVLRQLQNVEELFPVLLFE